MSEGVRTLRWGGSSGSVESGDDSDDVFALREHQDAGGADGAGDDGFRVFGAAAEEDGAGGGEDGETGAKAVRMKRADSLRVSIGWLREQRDELKISLAGLVAAVAINHEKAEVPFKVDKQWYDTFMEEVIVDFLALSKEIMPGILPLGTIHSDPYPLALVWTDGMENGDIDRALGELLAQLIMNIGHKNKKRARYDSRAHYALIRVAKILGIPHEVMGRYEILIGELVENAASFSDKVELTDEEKQEQSHNRTVRNIKVGAAAVVGATLVGITGGLALPAIGLSLASFGGAAATTGAFMASVGGTALFTTLFTAGGLGLTGYKMSRRYGSSLEEFEFRHILRPGTTLQYRPGLHVCIFLSGWVSKKKNKDEESEKLQVDEGDALSDGKNEQAFEQLSIQDDVSPPPKPPSQTLVKQNETNSAHSERELSVDEQTLIKELQNCEWTKTAANLRAELGEPFDLVWERKIVEDVSKALRKFAVNKAVSTAVQETLARTALATLMAAVTWPSLILSATEFIDNAWAVGVNRAELAGEELARAILSGAQGHRPVTLVGYSLGGVAIFHCLRYIANKKKSKLSSVNVDGIILNVVIMGAPISAKDDVWNDIRSIVSGSFVNGYCSKDWILAVLYRSSLFSVSKIAGLSPIEHHGFDNVDLGEGGLISSQVDYHDNLDICMELMSQKLFTVPPRQQRP
mmetsp:Transcript_1945/g.3146  ORF Transcript_1945/g.3146 Transcript_1945/m.3146 type:complete len:692 (-) Transcript_1945:50-2125(-)|eukprot:CAMPEP_0203776154 /NCGR_PEP_ID=MMETSP0099_2-20121227/6570_1 /ASSEMBLY_ACC=CAM_ASM_000209 /TAXON_ID=96639 /ORGANISM=" , Strain NY0313808BC1" /LENGTH=691 /DNA_ID=CAMNT_0050675093 /DNA_START=3 /DNA_END=2078 /DNA_ORIENTATION=-